MAHTCSSPCIQVTFLQLSSPPTTSTQLLLADSGEDMQKWVQVLNELKLLLNEQKPQDRSVRLLKEAYDSALPLIRTSQCAAIIGDVKSVFVPTYMC